MGAEGDGVTLGKCNIGPGLKRSGGVTFCGLTSICLDVAYWQWMERAALMCGDV